MEALLFGDSSRPLYGVYHPAAVGKNRYEGVVLCGPFGQEYMRSHRALRLLADKLSNIGFHILRFDYSGTGNSSLEPIEVSPKDWINDIRAASEELADIADIRKINLVGLRLGGLLALLAAFDKQFPGRLVLWDSVFSGKEYVDELVAMIGKNGTKPNESNFVEEDGSIHFNGFTLPATFRKDLESLNIKQHTDEINLKILQIVSSESPARRSLKQDLQLTKLEFQHMPTPFDWNYVDHVGGILLPTAIIQQIVEWLGDAGEK